MDKFRFMKGVAAAALAVLLSGCATRVPDFRQVVSEAKAAVAPSVVFIRVIYNDTESGRNRKGVASGSGVVISSDGEVLTNHHVIDKTSEIRCQLADGRSFPAKVLGKDKDLDIALLKLELPDGAEPPPVAKLSAVAPTALQMLGIPVPPEMTTPSLLAGKEPWSKTALAV